MIFILSESDSSLPYQYAKEKINDKNIKRNRVERKIYNKRSNIIKKKKVFTNDLSSGKGFIIYDKTYSI